MILIKLRQNKPQNLLVPSITTLKLLLLLFCYQYSTPTKMGLNTKTCPHYHHALLTSPKCHKVGQLNIINKSSNILILHINVLYSHFYFIYSLIILLQTNYYYLQQIHFYIFSYSFSAYNINILLLELIFIFMPALNTIFSIILICFNWYVFTNYGIYSSWT